MNYSLTWSKDKKLFYFIRFELTDQTQFMVMHLTLLEVQDVEFLDHTCILLQVGFVTFYNHWMHIASNSFESIRNKSSENSFSLVTANILWVDILHNHSTLFAHIIFDLFKQCKKTKCTSQSWKHLSGFHSKKYFKSQKLLGYLKNSTGGNVGKTTVHEWAKLR